MSIFFILIAIFQAPISLCIVILLQIIICSLDLRVYFTGVQAYEYLEASFTLTDSCYGSCFFVATGFHGLHVLIGRI